MLINDDEFKSNSELVAEPRRLRRPSNLGGGCFCLLDKTRRGKPLRLVSEKAATESVSRFEASSVVGSFGAVKVFALSSVTVRGSGAGRGASKAPLSTSESPIPWVEGGEMTVKDDPGRESSEDPGRCT